MRGGRLTGVLVLVLVLGACGGSDNSSPEAGVVENGGDGGSVSGSDGGNVSATVQVGGETYEFDTASACSTNGMIAIQFEDGEDWVSLNVAGDVILVRMLLGGKQWVDLGSPDPPTVAGNSVSWSGPMSSDGEQEQVTMDFAC
jgi:hypothetical protein